MGQRIVACFCYRVRVIVVSYHMNNMALYIWHTRNVTAQQNVESPVRLSGGIYYRLACRTIKEGDGSDL